MRHGVLTKPSPGLNLLQAVEQAIRNFNNAPHCGRAGRLPAEVRFNPADIPAERNLGGLSVLPDSNVRVGHIRVTTADLLPPPTPEEDEFTAALREYHQLKDEFEQQTRAAVHG